MIEDVKKSTVRLYESCVFDRLLGDTLRPGGLPLTARLAQVAGITAGHTVLDIACGRGTTTFFLAKEHNCHVTGTDLSVKMIASCRSRADKELVSNVTFLLGDAESLPFGDGCFDFVISECSFSLLPNKEMAAREIWRVLKPGGKLAMTDIILRGEVDNQLRDQVAFACCLGGAWRLEEYIRLFERAGFQSPYSEDHSHEIKKVAFRLGMTFGSVKNLLAEVPTGPCEQKKKTEDVVYSVQSYQQFLKTGRPGYALLSMTKREAT